MSITEEELKTTYAVLNELEKEDSNSLGRCSSNSITVVKNLIANTIIKMQLKL